MESMKNNIIAGAAKKNFSIEIFSHIMDFIEQYDNETGLFSCTLRWNHSKYAFERWNSFIDGNI